MDFSKFVNSGFKGCGLFCKVDASPTFPGKYIKVYKIPGAGIEYYGAKYPRGACMIWPSSWLHNRSKKEILGPYKEGHNTKAQNRIRLNEDREDKIIRLRLK